MPYRDPKQRSARARLCYATNSVVRADALERSRKQRERFKNDPEYNLLKREWRRRWRRKVAERRCSEEAAQ